MEDNLSLNSYLSCVDICNADMCNTCKYTTVLALAYDLQKLIYLVILPTSQL